MSRKGLTMANAVVSQSGGPTGVINASLVGVIEEVCKHDEIENLYGALHAVRGIINEDFIDLKKLFQFLSRSFKVDCLV